LDSLTDAQKICLYRGFHALFSLRDGLQRAPVVRALGSHNCQEFRSLKEKWETVAKELQTLPRGPREFISEIKKRLDWSECAAREGCRIRLLLARIDGFLNDFDTILIEVFAN
jgi:hypothetical protein